MYEVVERVVGIVQQQILLLYIPEDGFPFVQAGQLHGLRLFDGAYGMVGIGQVPQVLHIEMLVARHQFPPVYMIGIYQEIQEVLRHGTVIDKTADISDFAFLHLGLYLLYDFGSVGGIVYQDIRIA